MVGRHVYVEHLRRVSLFSGLTKKELELVAMAGSEVHVAAGTCIFDQGNSGHDAVVLLDGDMIAKRNGRKVATFHSGDIVGELALLDNGVRSATIETVTDCSLLVISHGNFRAVLDDVPALSHKLLASMAGRIRDLDRHLLG